MALTISVLVAASGCQAANGGSTALGRPSPTAAEGGDQPTDAASLPDPRPPSPSPSATGGSQVEEAVLSAYHGYWDAIRAANDPPDENHPDLKRYATGKAYASVFDAAQTNRLAGRALRLPDDSVTEHRVEVIAIDGDTATVRDCSVNDGLVVDIDTGEVVNDDVVTRLATGTLRRVDGTWKVATTEVEKTWEGVAGCAVAD